MRTPFERFDPRAPETPVVVEVPHPGLDVPPWVTPAIDPREGAMERDADRFVDELYAGAPDAGATVLVARISRYVVDLNRGEEDYDAESVVGGPTGSRAPRGVVWRLTGDGDSLLPRPLSRAELEARLDAIHRPYHSELTRILEEKRAKFGVAILLAAHSMPSFARTAGGTVGPPRADVVPGTRGRTTCDPRILAAVEGHAMARGWSVRHDDPYRGGYSTAAYGRPHEHFHAVQVELARRLYMDEVRLVRASSFDAVRDWCRGLVAKLGETALG